MGVPEEESKIKKKHLLSEAASPGDNSVFLWDCVKKLLTAIVSTR